MNDRDRGPDKSPRDYDLTGANIFGDDAKRPPRPAPQDDRTTINKPAQGPEARPTPARPAPNKFDLTGVHVGVPFDEDEPEARRPYPAPQQQTPPAVAPAAPRRKVPGMVWVALGALALVLAGGAVVLFLLFSSGRAFTLRVKSAPPGSKVFIDGVPSGVPQADGTIIVQGLRAAEAREVRVTRAGFADWATTVTGKGGEVHDLTVSLTPLREQPTAGSPTEIDYRGPMILIPAGEFTMGYARGNPDEAPEHPVSLPDFYIDKYEVTNEQYASFCEATGRPKPVNPFWSRQYFESNPRMPVIGISYADAEAFAAWIGKRLPTEAEWEKAASWGPGARAKRQYPWGDGAEGARANASSEHPTEVGRYTAGVSAYGVHDMAGNAREWVDATYAAYPGGGSAPDFGKGLRVARGGDFRSGLKFSRTTSRIGVDPAFKTNPGDDQAGRSSLIGFRCAVSADDPKLKAFLQSAR